MSNPTLSRYSAKIKDIYIELKNYNFFHSPYHEGDERFIGREKVKNRIVAILKNASSKSGSYLITGFRGMGKTSVLRQAIEEYNKPYKDTAEEKEEENWKVVKFNFIKRTFVYYLSFLFLAYLLGWETICSNWIPLAIFLFISSIINWKLYTYSKRIGDWFSNTYSIRNAIWDFFKLAFISITFIGLCLYIYDPGNFCINDSTPSTGKFCCVPSPFEIPWPYLLHPLKGSKIFFPLGIIFCAYSIFSVFFFFIDLLQLGYNNSKLFGKKQKSRKEKRKKYYQRFEINLSQESLNEVDVLRRMTNNIYDYWLSEYNTLNYNLFNRKFFFFWRFILLTINPSKKKGNKYEDILSKLASLKKRISGQVTSKNEIDINPNITTGIQGGLTRIAMPIGKYHSKDEVVYPIASSKEIEDELVAILWDIDKIRENDNRWAIPNFIFIIDELDKIGPHTDSTTKEKEFTNPSLDLKFNYESSQFRQRQEAVIALLANLKGFLNVIRAKFFFIGGREMFDADLADIADRDSFFSSVFNDVIYIESFFKDSDVADSGVTQLTERYLCKVILNDFEIKSANTKITEPDYNLKALYESIKHQKDPNKEIALFFNEGTNNNVTWKSHQHLILSEEELKRQKYKTIFTLQNYIIYLNYRSNGTPKKLTALIEQLIKSGPKNINKDGETNNSKFLKDNIVLFQNADNDPLTEDLSEKLFLHFDYNTQYEIGLTANLYRPYLIVNSRHLKLLGDKLLFSSSFIIDHLLKFHPFGFSGKNLEHIPEIILVNREPNLRSYIEDLMRFYSLTYIRNTISGIFDYKFRSVVKRELIYASKTSDLSSAAFNFTLDESLSIKRHYTKKLMELRENYKNHQPIKKDNQFVHSLFLVRTVLGDLYFYDKEYDEAILYYSESIQPLRLPNTYNDKKPITQHQFILLLKNKLKIGLTFEKMRDFEEAISTYQTGINDVEEYLTSISRYKNRNRNTGLFDEVNKTIHLLSMPYVALLSTLEKIRQDGITLTNLLNNRMEFIETIFSTPKPETESGQRIKRGLPDQSRRNFLLADYYNNVGSILFYKNAQYSVFFEESESEKNIQLEVYKEGDSNNLLGQQREVYKKEIEQGIASKDKIREFDFNPSLSAFNYYWNSLYFLLKDQKEILLKYAKLKDTNSKSDDTKTYDSYDQNYLIIASSLLLPRCVDLMNSNRFYYIASVIAKLGDCILSSLCKDDYAIPDTAFNPADIIDSDKKPNPYSNSIHNFIDSLDEQMKKEKLFQIESVLSIYKLAAALFLRSGQNSYYSLQLKKILYIIKDLTEIRRFDIQRMKKEDKLKELNNLKTFLGITETMGVGSNKKEVKKYNFKMLQETAEKIFKSTTWNNEIANRPQILKYREILDIRDPNDDREYIYHNINNINDNREVVILIESIKMKMKLLFTNEDKETNSEAWMNFLGEFGLSKTIISSYHSMNNQFVRILELKYRSERCHFIAKEILGVDFMFKSYDFQKQSISSIALETIKARMEEIIYEDPLNDVAVGEIFAFITREALFCLRELIKMIKLYDPGYVISFSYIAEAHSRMGDWCHAFKNYKAIWKFLEKKKKEKFNLSDLEIIQLIENKQFELKTLNDELLKEPDSKDIIDKTDQLKIELSILRSSEILANFENEITELLGKSNMVYLESKNHYESAIQYYYQVTQMHSEGKAYQDQLLNLYILEDDYNDNTTHFTIASERQRVNIGNIRDKIVNLYEKIGKSNLYDYASYISSNESLQNEQNKTPEELEEIKQQLQNKEKTIRDLAVFFNSKFSGTL